MGLDKLQELRDQWRADTELVQALGAAFDAIGFTDAYIDTCLDDAARGRVARKTKYIKDNVWGMIEFDWRAMRLVDSPLLQRLRSIKQLGVSYLTYPTAEHSRFVHSLGITSVVAQFLAAADEQGREPFAPGSDKALRLSDLAPVKKDDLLHAALLHDIGHMPFSHAVEFAVVGEPNIFRCGPHTVSELLGDVGLILRADVSLSEILSLLVVTSNRFERFYKGFVSPGEEDDDVLLRVGCLIAGIPATPRLTGVTQLISAAAIDADKIDYVSRDARACGLPIGVDFSRIFLRSAFLEKSREDLIRAGLKDNPAPSEVLFIVNASGVDTIDEITQARAALYQRVYLHPVTRTAEAILARALERNALDKEKGLADLSDALGLWAMSDDALLRRLGSASTSDAASLAIRLQTRRLPKKACAFCASVADMQMPLRSIFRDMRRELADEIQKLVVHTPLEALNVKYLGKGEARRIETSVVAEARRLAALMKAAKQDSVVPAEDIRSVILVGSSYMDRVRKEAIIWQGGELLRTSAFTNVRETQDALEIFKAIGYVMSEPDWAPLVCIAARTVLAEPKHNLRPAPIGALDATAPPTVLIQERMILDLRGVARRSGIKREALDRAVNAAVAAGYFDDKPFLAPKLVSDDAAVRAVAERLRTFSGQASWQIVPEVVASFLSQFPIKLRDSMLRSLGELVFFDAPTMVAAIQPLIATIGNELDVVGLSPSSGSAVLTALKRANGSSLAVEGIRFRSELREALLEDSEQPIVFVDDNVASGVQSTAQFLSWAGVPREEWPPECQREDGVFGAPLTEIEISRLRKRPIHIAVCAGRSAAEARLRPSLERAGYAQFRGLTFAYPLEGISWPEELRTYLQAKGLSLLAWTRFQKRPEELSGQELDSCSADAFGYGNVGGLTATASNVPTSTVTALWCPGMAEGAPWMPLMIRQNKLRHLVVA